MIEKLEGFNQHLIVACFSNVKIADIDKFLKDAKKKLGNASVQFLDATKIAGREHLHFAALNALNAFKNKLNISNSLAMETLLYASGQHQIKEAVKLLGINPNSSQIAVLVLAQGPKQASTIVKTVSQLMPGKRDDSALKFTSEKTTSIMRLFQISKVELEAKTERRGDEKAALLDLVIEHMALLATAG